MEQQIDTEKMGVDPDKGVGVQPTTANSTATATSLLSRGDRTVIDKCQRLVEECLTETQSCPPPSEDMEDSLNYVYQTLTHRDIKDDYTPKDRANITWAQVKGHLQALPGCAKYAQQEEKTREGIDMRLLGERIKECNKDFGLKYNRAQQLLSESSRMLDKYAQQRLDHHTQMTVHADNAATLDERVSAIRLEMEHVKNAGLNAETTDERMQHSIEVGQFQKELDQKEFARNRYARKSKHHTNMMMVYTVLHASMKQQCDCVDTMVNVLQERGTHIGELLDTYKRGGNSSMVAKFKRELELCHLVRGRLVSLDKEYQQHTNDLAQVPAMQDKDLYAAYDRTRKQETKRSDQGKEDFMKQYNDTLKKALG
jgi:hypothetical protein